MPKIKLVNNKSYKSVFFIGIGGVSMRGLAEILHGDGYTVSGSDRNESDGTRTLMQSGIQVFIGHDASHIKNKNIDLAVYTAAVPEDNPELVSAKNDGIDLMTRAELLGRIMRNYRHPICISGTHGKTTVTSMTSDIFLSAYGNDPERTPTISNGGFLKSINGTFRKGSFEYMIVESCEYYNSFLNFYPFVGVILNIELDHTDFFKSYEDIRASFRRFAGLIPSDGALVVYGGIGDIGGFTDGLECNVITFGINGSTWRAENISYDTRGNGGFDAVYKDNKIARISLSVPGEHNVMNALAAIAASSFLGVPESAVAAGLSTFTGADRRFQYIGECNGVQVYDDYAHHPSEIKATLKAAQNIPHRELWAVFQPHTHTRTKELLTEFSESFDLADNIIVLDIYSPAGREEKDCDIHSLDLIDKIKSRKNNVFYFNNFDSVVNFLKTGCINRDMLITMGAGNVFLVAERMVRGCQ